MYLVHPNYCHITDLLVVDLCSSLAYFVFTLPLPVAAKFPIELSLLCNYQHTHTHTCYAPCSYLRQYKEAFTEENVMYVLGSVLAELCQKVILALIYNHNLLGECVRVDLHFDQLELG